MLALTKGCYRVRTAQSDVDLKAAQRLRYIAFHPDTANPDQALDSDRFDALCTHVLVEDMRSGQLVCCFRVLEFQNGGQIESSYAAQFYELSSLKRFSGRMIEIGRFCIHPDHSDPDILRLAWASLTRHVDAQGIEMLFGCSSFHGTDQAPYLDTFAMLRASHLAPMHWRPKVKALDVFRFAARLRRRPDRRKALQVMPPLLRTYLLMGGWVSDHAVIDAQLGTMHVFTGLEISAIPDARKKLLRAVSA